MLKAGTIILVACFFVCSLSEAHTQKPQPVHSFVKELHPFDWYVEQAALWQQEIVADSLNAEAWWNYYVANRMANFTGTPEQRTLAPEGVLKSLQQIIADMGKKIPESFEYNLIVWWTGGNNPENLAYFEKARKLGPERIEIQDDIMTRAEITRTMDERKHAAETWFKSGDLSTGLMELNYNTLMSVPEHAVLFVMGDNDTYQKWILQDVLNIRPDVVVLNISLLYIEEYRKAVFQEMDLPAFKTQVADLITEDDKKSGNYQAVYNRFQLEIIKHVLKHSKDPVYFSSFISTRVIEAFENHLYLEGLAFRYSEEDYDNLAVLRKNVEQKFHFDYLDQPVNYDVSESVLTQSNRNYFLPFRKLYNHFRASGEDYKAQRLEIVLRKIARKAGLEAELMQEFDND